MPLLFPFFLVVGLFLPGYFCAKYLGHRLWWASAFSISLLILFHSIFWLGVAGAPITVWSVFLCLMCAMGVAARLAKRAPTSNADRKSTSTTAPQRILLIASAMVGSAMVARSVVSPLIGADSLFRWDFLARQILSHRTFGFYPPLTPSDFHQYFSIDAIPPLVSFVHWWLYASFGSHSPWLISLFIGAQFACTLAFTYGAGAELFSRRVGFLAAGILSASPLYFRSVVIGQETGLTALAIAATIYFISSARDENELWAIVSAAMAAGLCALSREYGWIAVIAGTIVMVWRRHAVRHIFVFATVAVAIAFPWYLRTWALTGNPFYSLRFGPFAVNPIYDGLYERYHSLLGVQTWSGTDWMKVAGLLILGAPIQLLAGLTGGIARFRKYGYLLVVALLIAAVWIQSAGYTSGGVANSVRVLTPALVVLSILAAAVLEPLTSRVSLSAVVICTVVLCQLWTAAHGVFYPADPVTVPPNEWSQEAFQSVPPAGEFQISDDLAQYLPPGSRLLSENAFLHAALLEKGIDVVPVWSPEVRFLFSASPEEAERRLRSLGIGTVAYYPASLNTEYLLSASPFYGSLSRRWEVRIRVLGLIDLYGPAESAETTPKRTE